MKRAIILAVSVILVSVQSSAQDWKPCEAIKKRLDPVIYEFNKVNSAKGLNLSVMCTYSGDPSYHKKPEVHVPISAEESKLLDILRTTSNKAFLAQDAYEKYLMSVHKVKKPEIGEDCFYFAGFRYGENFITIDPNPYVASPKCLQPIKWRTD